MTDPVGLLVVSADVALRAHVRLALGSERFVVRAVPDGPAALHELATWAPSLLLVDTALPPGDVRDLLQGRRSHGGPGEVPCLLLEPAGPHTLPQTPSELGDDPAGDVRLRSPTTAFALLRRVEAMLSA